MDRLATDHYSKHYISDIEVVDRDSKGLPAPEVQNTLLSGHEERVQNHKNGGSVSYTHLTLPTIYSV